MTKKEEAELKRAAKLQAERDRLELMKEYEYKHSDCALICGIDEAGRGPFAGPVVAGAVILNPEKEILYLNDSKKLSEKKREALFEEIKEKALYVGVGIVDSQTIDSINILQATYKAMQQAIEGLGVKPDFILADAVHIPGIDIPQEGIIKGDAKSISIAAASIIAKVTRDHIMYEYDKQFPEYGFASHKGYGTAAHIEAIKKYGPLDIHRRSFIHNYL
ncbi:MAG: ribonuclease HII [Parasporobacterium sp.]|nr:ribonuclease HII [Parasporobacterium sp.]